MALKKIKNRLITLDMEIALSYHFKYRRNLIVPNVSWGLELHECDLLMLTPTGYATEIEIKISKADLIKDKNKLHGHESHKIKYLYFAIPEYLLKYKEHIPERAGIVVVHYGTGFSKSKVYVRVVRKPKANPIKYKWDLEERYKLARLGSLRIWSLKSKINKLKKKGGK